MQLYLYNYCFKVRPINCIFIMSVHIITQLIILYFVYDISKGFITYFKMIK